VVADALQYYVGQRGEVLATGPMQQPTG
jgi:hypothetical protein